MKHLIIITFVSFFISLSFLSKAVEIKEGYWAGVSIQEKDEIFFTKIEEWHFENGILEFKRYDHKLKPAPFSAKGKYRLTESEFILSDESWDKNISFPIIIEEERIILFIKEWDSKVYLYYSGEKPVFSTSKWKQELSETIYSIDKPMLFINSNEVEFWDFASFYSRNKIAKCHHSYNVFQFGEHHFILFKSLVALKILKKEGNKIIVELISDEQELVTFTPLEHHSILNMDSLKGEWKWKETESKPNNINYYTISIGYNMHRLKIEKDGFIQWFTESYYEQIASSRKIRSKNPFIIPPRIKKFQNSFYPKERKDKEIPFIKISPSKRLVIFESFPIHSEPGFQGQVTFYSQIQILQFVEKSDMKILFKYPYLNGRYVTLTRVTE